MIDALKKFKSIHGHLDVPDVYQADQKLADFVKEQRAKYHRGQLSMARIKQLEDLGLVLKEEEDEEEEEEDEQAMDEDGSEGEAEGEDEDDGADADDDGEGNSHQEEDEDMIRYDDAFKQQYQKLVDFHIKYGHCR